MQTGNREGPMRTPSRTRQQLVLAIPIFLGLLLRAYAIDFGRAYRIPFGDEMPAAREASDAVANLQLLSLKRNGWLFYLICAPFQYLLSVANPGSLDRRFVYNAPIFERVVVGRTLNVFFGVATVLLTFLIARQILGRRSAIWSALAIALSPITTVVGHFNTRLRC